MYVYRIVFPQDTLKVEIVRFLDEWHDDASRADMPAYFEKIDEQGIYIGTDATENWTKQAFKIGQNLISTKEKPGRSSLKNVIFIFRKIKR